MNQKELNTFEHFIESNNFFLTAIKNLSNYEPDIYVKIELLILYIKNKFKPIIFLTNTNIVIRDLINGNYYIEDNNIFINDELYTFEQLYFIVQNIKIPRREPSIIRPIKNQSKSISFPNTKCQIIDINPYMYTADFTPAERAYIFERNCKVDDVTIPFIADTNENFLELLEHIINSLLTNSINIDEDYYYKVIIASLKLYPFMDYANGKLNFSFESISLPLNEIGLTKVKYQDEYLETIKIHIAEINKRIQKLLHETEIIVSSGFITNKEIINGRNRKIVLLNTEIAGLLLEYNEYSHNPSVLNKVLFEYMYQAFSHGNVIINTHFLDPVIKLFTISNKEVTSYIAIHLNTLLNIIDTDLLLSRNIPKKEYAAE